MSGHINWEDTRMQVGFDCLFVGHPKLPLHKLFVDENGELVLEKITNTKPSSVLEVLELHDFEKNLRSGRLEQEQQDPQAYIAAMMERAQKTKEEIAKIRADKQAHWDEMNKKAAELGIVATHGATTSLDQLKSAFTGVVKSISEYSSEDLPLPVDFQPNDDDRV